MPKTLAEAELRRLARLGAIARLKEIEEEAAAIRGAFPGLAATRPTKERAPEKRARRRRPMSPEAREAARKRMQEYWARKKSQGGDAASAGAAAGNGHASASQRKRRATKRSRGKKGR